MKKEVTILMAEDDMGHADLIRRNLVRSGLINSIIHFRDGQEIVDFLFMNGSGPKRESGMAYVLLLDIRMPKLNGMDVLTMLKADSELCKIPVIMITTTDDPRDVAHCHSLGCSSFISKPVEYDRFMHAIRQMGLYLAVVEVPTTELPVI